ncbi:MAG: XisI protein [Symploca sp. SIO3E6]|nr:XisI protein [Caldora sp. SIO3E6]
MALDYSELIEDIIQKRYENSSTGQVRVEKVIDRENQHYLLIQVGWMNDKWYYGNLLHLDIIDGKIHIQQNNTEDLIAQKLVDLGVPKTDIVLGFHAPFERQFTEYALG